jgi:uncharacterized Zn finger protein (UPF0148 family)
MNCCGKAKYVKYIWSLIGFIVLVALVSSLTSCGKKDSSPSERRTANDEIRYYTCGMHPSVKVSPEEYKRGNVNCPICNMKLTPVHKEEAGADLSSKAFPPEADPPLAEAKEEDAYYGCGVYSEGKCPHCDFGQRNTECICGEHSFIIKEQKMNCPVCSEPLKKLTQEEADKLKGVVSRVKIKGKQAKLAGVKTEPVRRLHLYKEIRTVGTVAYDPKLAIAQEEFISTLKTLDKIREGTIPEIEERAQRLAESSKRKLRLLGLSNEQIEELGQTKEIQTSLILPEEKMWIYGDVYEYELSWVKVGGEVKVTTSSLPGDVFKGVIASVNPVLDPKTRSVRFRVEINNPELKLKPEMYVDVIIESMYMSPDGAHMVLAIPKDALLDTGTRKIVWVYKGGEEYEGRIIEVGPTSTAVIDEKEVSFYPVLKGLEEGELVVTKANFLIDSQSQITGVAASSYSGAIGAEEEPAPPLHQH